MMRAGVGALMAAALVGCAPFGAGEPEPRTLQVLFPIDFGSIDPAVNSFRGPADSMLRAVHRSLYRFTADDPVTPAPDLAAAPPRISPDGRRITIRIRRGVRFSPPVGREVVASDVRYAIERSFRPSVGSPYAQLYFGDLEGVEAFMEGRSERISGLRTPSRDTLVLRLRRPRAGVLVPALTKTLTAPVPREYARRFDAERVSTYDRHQVATGPYMIRSDRSGRLTGWKPGNRIDLVRNPSWDPAARPAIDRVVFRLGTSYEIAAQTALKSRATVAPVFGPITGGVVRELHNAGPERVAVTDPGMALWYSLNARVPPFDDVDVRRAVLAAFDRRGLAELVGGFATPASHFIPPGTRGHVAAGGRRGPDADFLRRPSGDMRVARRYLRTAGYPEGRITDAKPITLIDISRGGSTSSPSAEYVQDQLSRLGLRVRVRLLAPGALPRICGAPRSPVAICALRVSQEFREPRTVLRSTFDGRLITRGFSVNYSHFGDTEISQAMDRADGLTDAVARGRAWAAIDRELTRRAVALPALWIKGVTVSSPDVNLAIDPDAGTVDLATTRLR